VVEVVEVVVEWYCTHRCIRHIHRILDNTHNKLDMKFPHTDLTVEEVEEEVVVEVEVVAEVEVEVVAYSYPDIRRSIQLCFHNNYNLLYARHYRNTQPGIQFLKVFHHTNRSNRNRYIHTVQEEVEEAEEAEAEECYNQDQHNMGYHSL
jgi:hypothetical protein